MGFCRILVLFGSWGLFRSDLLTLWYWSVFEDNLQNVAIAHFLQRMWEWLFCMPAFSGVNSNWFFPLTVLCGLVISRGSLYAMQSPSCCTCKMFSVFYMLTLPLLLFRIIESLEVLLPTGCGNSICCLPLMVSSLHPPLLFISAGFQHCPCSLP